MSNAISLKRITFCTLIKEALEAQLKIIGNNLHRLRKERNESVEAVANAVDISPIQLARIENGQINMRVTTLFDLCDHYGAPLETVVK